MLYDQIMEIYGFYIILSGFISFGVAAFIGMLLMRGVQNKYEQSSIGNTRCYAKIKKKKRGKVYFEIETGEIVALSVKKKEYYGYFENVEGILTYRGNKVISFE